MDHVKEYRPNNQGTARLMGSPLLERLTRTHISVPLLLLSAIAVALLLFGNVKKGMDFGELGLFFVGGLLSFTLMEYVVHRYVYHIPATGPRMKRFAYVIHGVHHDYPRDKSRLAMPPILSLTLTFIFYLFFRLIMGEAVFGFLPGFVIGYTAYLGVHYSVHAFRMPKNFLKILWVHHAIHHYREPDRAFGVSSPLWDVIFGTMPTKSAVRRIAEKEDPYEPV